MRRKNCHKEFGLEKRVTRKALLDWGLMFNVGLEIFQKVWNLTKKWVQKNKGEGGGDCKP